MAVPPANDAPVPFGEPVMTRLPARSRQQALDWSLVLASQGFEPVIDFSEEAGGWALWVPAQDCDKAAESIRLYQQENRGWPWQKEILFPGVLFDWASLAWTLLICLFFWLNDTTGSLRSAGMMDSIAVSKGQWWRLFTAIWLHADLAHLAANATIGIVLLGLAMGRYGTGTGLLAAYLAGAGGNLFAWCFAATPHNSLGASGMVMGCLGLIAVQSLLALQTSASQPKWARDAGAAFHRAPPGELKRLITGAVCGLMLFILLGLAPGSDLQAHLGGFLSGLLLGGALRLMPRLSHRPAANLACGLLFTAFAIVPWYLALTA